MSANIMSSATLLSVTGIDSPRNTGWKAPSKRPSHLIYGEATMGGLVFIERSKALENIAFRAAVTWGDFRKGTPTLYTRSADWMRRGPPPYTKSWT